MQSFRNTILSAGKNDLDLPCLMEAVKQHRWYKWINYYKNCKIAQISQQTPTAAGSKPCWEINYFLIRCHAITSNSLYRPMLRTLASKRFF